MKKSQWGIKVKKPYDKHLAELIDPERDISICNDWRVLPYYKKKKITGNFVDIIPVSHYKWVIHKKRPIKKRRELVNHTWFV